MLLFPLNLKSSKLSVKDCWHVNYFLKGPKLKKSNLIKQQQSHITRHKVNQIYPLENRLFVISVLCVVFLSSDLQSR